MKEAKKDLFASIYDNNVDAICITTNRHWTLPEGNAVMGGGCAGICRERWPEMCRNLGQLLKKNTPANVPFLIGGLDHDGRYHSPETALKYSGYRKCLVFSFPTIDDLMEGAKLELIHNSSVIMTQYADAYRLNGILLPRPGAGIGGLNWLDVKDVIEPILDDRFTIVSFEHEE